MTESKGFKAQEVILRCHQLPSMHMDVQPGAQKATLPCPLLPLAHSLFQYENPILLGMCQQNPDLSYQPQLSFACSQPDHHSWLHGKAFCVFPASVASSSVSIYQRLTTRVPWGGLSPSAHQKSLPPLFSPLPCSSSAHQEGSGAHVDWPLWSLKALLPRGRSSKGNGKKGYARRLSRAPGKGGG